MNKLTSENSFILFIYILHGSVFEFKLVLSFTCQLKFMNKKIPPSSDY